MDILLISRLLIGLFGGLIVVWQTRLAVSPKRQANWAIVKEPLFWPREAMSVLTSVLLSIFVFHPAPLSFAKIIIPLWATIFGWTVLALGFLLWLWAQTSLGENWSGYVAKRQGHTLTTIGPYQFIRHPMYSAYILFGLGVILATANWLVGGLYMLSVVLTVSCAWAEEKLMAEIFKDNWQRYQARTGRFVFWLPGFVGVNDIDKPNPLS